MKKILFSMIVFAVCCLLPDITVPAAENNITFTYPSKDTLVIKGTGMVPGHEGEGFYDGDGHPNIKKIIIEEGITGLGSYAISDYYPYAETIELPATLRTIGKGAFLRCYSLKEIKLPSGISEILQSCFEGCRELERIEMPDTVTKIDKDAFRECGKLKELVLPKQLTVWNDPIQKCPQLKEITNRSLIEVALDDYKGGKIWYSKGKKVKKLGAGMVAKSKGKKYKIKYNLLGGKRSGKLPSGYTFGKSVKLPLHAKKKNYTLLGWYNPKDADNVLHYCSEISSIQTGNIKLRPFWVKYRIKAVGSRSVKIFLDDRDAIVEFGAFDVRYSTSKNMKNAKSFTMHSKGNTKLVPKLKKGKAYYFQVAYRDLDADIDMDEDGGSHIWVGKKRIVVK